MGMDDEPERDHELDSGETIPMASSEPKFDRIESPLDESTAILGHQTVSEPPEDPHPEEKQFSLRGVLILFTVACCILGVGARLRIDIFAGLLGILTLVTAGLMVRIWKTALVVILIAAAVLSPTNDIPNMMLFAAPMLVLYVISIFIAWIFNKPRTTT